MQVRSVIRQRFSRWQEGRTIATRYTRTSIATNVDQIMAGGGVLGGASNMGELTGLAAAEEPKVHNTRRVSQTSVVTRDYMHNNNSNGVNHMAIPMLSLNDEAL